MLRVLSTSAQTKAANRDLRSSVEKNFKSIGVKTVIFPGGGKATVDAFQAQTRLGSLVVSFNQETWDSRTPFFINLNPPQNNFAPNVEINIPFKLDRTVAGCFAHDDVRNRIVLCSRGKFTAYKSPIKKEVILEFFSDWLVAAEDGDREVRVIAVSALDSPRFVEDLAEYAAKVIDLKKQGASNAKAPSIWRDGREYEGMIKGAERGVQGDYDYSHGPIKNSCKGYLEKVFDGKYDVRDSVQVDLALVKGEQAEVIFEIKTSANFGSQIFKAIGQLLVYKKRYGSKKCRMVLVVPKEIFVPELKIVSEFGIDLMLFDDDTLKLPNGSLFQP